MQLLQGTDVLLNGARVRNVLVGEPFTAAVPFGAGTTAGYVLGIPKEDAHDWQDGIVEVFGRTFRTVGIPEEGIAANIPGPWHRRVRIEALCINGAVTFWERDTFARHVCAEIFLLDRRGGRTDKAGSVQTGALQMMLYAPLMQDTWRPAPGDIAVPGVSSFSFGSTDEQGVSAGMAALRRAHPDLAVVREARPVLNGRQNDWEVTAG